MVHSEELATKGRTFGTAWSLDQIAAIQTEVHSIVAHPVFSKSKRCVALFNRLIDLALRAHHDGAKERTLGVDVFGREPGYDTNIDPVVRMTAGEIRKRLAQYYQLSPGRHAVRIVMAPGAYLPIFEFESVQNSEQFSVSETTIQDVLPSAALPAISAIPPQTVGLPAPAWQRLLTRAFPGLLIVIVAITLWNSNIFRSTQDLLWSPLLDSKERATICIASVNSDAIATTDPKKWAQSVAKIIETKSFDHIQQRNSWLPVVPLVDVVVSSRLGLWLQAHKKASDVRSYSSLTLEDLRRGPTVLVGAFDNPWTLVLLSDLQYRFRVDPTSQEEWIEDAKNPSQRNWIGNGSILFGDTSVDYALISRFVAPETGQWVLSAGGLGLHGTEAAAELLTNPRFAKTLPRSVRTEKSNFQIVLKTTVIDGHAGEPVIVAIHTW